jgi:hypothetical protein
MVVSTDLPLPEAAPVAHKQLPHLELRIHNYNLLLPQMTNQVINFL